VVVKLENKIVVTTVSLIASLLIFASVGAQSTRINKPPRLTEVSLSPLVVGGKVVGVVAVYDDATTKRPADCLELYDNSGHLLALGWFDEFGIQRMAIDRGLLENGDKLEGIFVVMSDGEPV
jgi:hypothetical protein